MMLSFLVMFVKVYGLQRRDQILLENGLDDSWHVCFFRGSELL